MKKNNVICLYHRDYARELGYQPGDTEAVVLAFQNGDDLDPKGDPWFVCLYNTPDHRIMMLPSWCEQIRYARIDPSVSAERVRLDAISAGDDGFLSGLDIGQLLMVLSFISNGYHDLSAYAESRRRMNELCECRTSKHWYARFENALRQFTKYVQQRLDLIYSMGAGWRCEIDTQKIFRFFGGDEFRWDDRVHDRTEVWHLNDELLEDGNREWRVEQFGWTGAQLVHYAGGKADWMAFVGPGHAHHNDSHFRSWVRCG